MTIQDPPYATPLTDKSSLTSPFLYYSMINFYQRLINEHLFTF